MYTNVVKESSPEVEDVEALDAAATKIVMNSLFYTFITEIWQ